MNNRSLTNLQKESDNLAARLPRLIVKAEKIALSVYHGLHGVKKPGTGETFWQFRNYEYGDSTSLIDWRKTASSQKVLIKEEESEVAQSILIYCDRSKSMNFTSNINYETKIYRSQLLALSIAKILLLGGEKVLTAENNSNLAGASIDHIANTLLYLKHNNTLPNITNIKNKSQLIYFSDFFENLETFKSLLLKLKEKEVTGILVQVLDSAEEKLPFGGRVVFESLENENALPIGKVESIKSDYQKKLMKLRENIKYST